MANWPGFDPSDPGELTRSSSGNMATELQLRARLDLQGVHRRRRAPAGPGHAARRCSTWRRRSRSPTGRSRSRTSAATSASRSPTSSPSPRNVGAVTIGLKLGVGATSTTGSAASASGARPGSQFPGEERGIVIPVKDYSGSTMGNLPIGQGLSVTPMQMAAAYSAIADGGVLRTPPPRALRERPEGPADPGKRVISRDNAASCARCSRACSPRAAPRRRSACPATRSPGKTGTAQKVVDGTYSDTQFVASFVGFAPGPGPAAAGRDRGRQPEGRHLRRHGRRAGLRRDRQVRAPLPRDPAAELRPPHLIGPSPP